MEPFASHPLEAMVAALRAASESANEDALWRALEASAREAREQERARMENDDLEAAIEASRLENPLRSTSHDEEMELASALSESATLAALDSSPHDRGDAVVRARTLKNDEHRHDISVLVREMEALKVDANDLEAAILEGENQFRAAWDEMREQALTATSETTALAAAMELSKLEEEHSTQERELKAALSEVQSQLELKVVEVERVRKHANREQLEMASVMRRLGAMLDAPPPVWELEENLPEDSDMYVRQPLADITPPPLAPAEGGDAEFEASTEEEQMEEAMRMSALAEDRRIQEEQDKEYEIALKKDEARRREEEALEEEWQKQQEEGKNLAAVEAFKAAQAKADLQSKRDMLRAEPEAGSEGVCHISVRLTNGARVKRRFLKHDRLQLIHDFVCVLGMDEEHSEAIPASFALVTDFPRRQFDDLRLTIEEADLCGALVSVVPTD